MDLIPQLLFTGIGIGAIYALVALGFVLLIRAASVVNFAQGEFSMLGAYFMVVLATGLGVPYLLSLPVAVAAMANGSSPRVVATTFGDGFWDLAAFTLQMAMVVLTGYVVATSGPVARIIERAARLPSTPRGAVRTHRLSWGGAPKSCASPRRPARSIAVPTSPSSSNDGAGRRGMTRSSNGEREAHGQTRRASSSTATRRSRRRTSSVATSESR